MNFIRLTSLSFTIAIIGQLFSNVNPYFKRLPKSSIPLLFFSYRIA